MDFLYQLLSVRGIVMNWLIAILFTVAINWATMKRYTVVRAILLIFVWLWVSFLTLFVFFYLMFELFPPDPYIRYAMVRRLSRSLGVSIDRDFGLLFNSKGEEVRPLASSYLYSAPHSHAGTPNPVTSIPIWLLSWNQS